MIVVSLDEYGRFETVSGCMLIVGAAYHCSTKKDVEDEQKRLKRFFEGVCEQQGARYPFDLHYNRDNGKIINAVEANRVKTALCASLPDFLKGKGAWAGDRPKGVYYLYAMVGGRNGR